MHPWYYSSSPCLCLSEPAEALSVDLWATATAGNSRTLLTQSDETRASAGARHVTSTT